MTNIVLLIFIKMLNIFLASTIPMNGINDSITKCAELKHKCNPYLQDPCCNPNRICVNKIRDQLYISDYICLKKGILNSPCKKSFDCEAIIGAKCSENGRCVCRKQSVAYNETICLRNSMDDRLVDELMDYYYDFTEIFYLKRNSSKSECQIISNTNYGEPCNNDIQCLEDHSNLKCINKECKCPNGTQFTLDTLTCQNSMGGINKPCLVNKKCSIENSYCNPYGICKCKVNYYYTLNDKCELDKSRSNCSKDDVFLHTQSRTLYRPAKKPNDPCLSNIDCNDVKHTTCQSNACKCIRNFYVSEKTGNCTRYAKQPNDRCIEDKGCRKVDNSKCKSRICQCDENFPLNLATKKCEILLGRKCTEDSNCDTTKNVVCSKGKCVCDVNHFEKNYTCVLGIDGYCKESEECYVNNSLCQNDRCQCAVNFYASKNKSLCIANAKALYDYCESDESCQEMENTECSNNKCQCKLKFVEKDGKCRSLYYCEVKSDCQQPKYSVCRNNRCVCSLNRYLSSNNTKCSSYAKSIGSSCEDDKRCARVKNTKCIEKKCACIENYFEDNNKCKGIIDAECSENSDCIADNSLCESNRCKCSENFHPSSDKRECRKYADHVNDLCEDNDDCTKVKNSKCSENDQCVCKMKYFEKDNECKAFIGTNCTENSECGANNSQCYSNECVCSHGFYSSINKQECIKYAAKPNEPCESNKSCTHVEYSYCSKSNECTCKPNYLLIDDKCRGLIGENCSVDSGCGVKYSTCKSNTCTCPIDYYPSNDKTNCFQYAKKLNDFCETDGACRDVKFTYCSENRQCTCLMNYTVTNDSCRGLIGTNCSEDLDCATDNSKCELNVCQCLQGFQFSFSKQRCYSYSKHLNDFCETNDDCNNLKYTYCTVNNKCSCLANYIAVDGRCAGLVGEKCSDDNDCAVDNSKCDDTTCQCKVDFYLSTNKDKCYSFASQVNDFCETDIGCQKLDRTRCWENACTCWPNYTIVDGNCRGLINAKCFVNSDCSIESSICASNTCQCPINFYLSADEKQCHSFAKHINDFCETDVGCRDLKFSYCSKDNKCTCLLGYIDDDGYCSGLIGSMCFKSLDCAADNAICDESKTCQCPVDFYLSVNKEECYSYAKKQTDFCETDIACRNLKYTYCSEDYKCACLQNYITVDGHCRGLINATCSEDSDCAVNNSICDESNTCQCPVSSYLSSNKDNCNLYAEKIYDYCDNDNSCRDLQFTYCSADKKCTCVSNYKEIAGHCRALINASCSQESECAANNSACELNICQCSIDFYPSSNKDKCLPYAKQLSDFCEANIGCRDVKYTYCSDDNRCVCSPNYTAVEGYCHGFIGSHCSESSDCASNNSICLSNICQCSVDSYLSTNDSKCHLLAKRIYDSCETDTGCRDLKYTYCLEDNRCTCLENYTIVNGYCLGLIDAKCSSDFDCAIDNSICDDSNTCQCPVDSYLSVGKNKCHPYVKHLHDFCENDMSCRGLKFTYCFEGKCTCLINYISNNGSCLGLIGSACSDDLECAAENSVCDQKNTCQCSVDFYPSLNKEKCHQYAKKLDDVCETDIGCRNLSFTNCSKDYKCSCFENYTVVNGYCRGLIDAKCSDDLDCAVENSICDESNTCQCSVDSYLSVEKNKCHPYAKHLHDFCENDMSCRGLKFTYCFEGKCTCLINYISNNGSCLGLIGSACSDDLECAAENSVCDQTNTCQCSVDFYPSLNKEKCHQYAKKLDDVCETDIGCRNLSFTNCSKDYKCSCIENYTVVNGYCRGLIDAKCSDDLDCAVENSICDESNTCQCSVDNYLSVDKRKCYAFAKQLNDFCESKNGCRDLKYTYCSEGNSCICSENYIEVDGYCRGLIGTNCSGNSDCAIERSICQSSTCQCPNDFYLSESGNQCYQYAKELNNFCETDISCREFKYTHCSDDNRCACLENYTVVDGNCRGLINANCSDDLDCAIENSICKFDTCQCSSNFYLSINKKKCYPYAKQLNDFCENDIGCTDLKHAVCSNSNQCTCSSNYAVIEGHCLGLIGANCSNDLDCGVDESICESNICQCRYGFYLSENQEKCYAQAKQLNEFCENDVGCSDLKYTVCSEENECVCLRNYTNMKGQCRADIGLNCSEDLDCAVDKSICKSNLCQCPNDYYVSTTKGKCFQYAKQLNEFCEDNVGCQDLKYSYCSQDNECICSANYREVSGYCRGLIGANCSDDLDCEAEYSSCDDFNTCQCEVDFYLSTNKDKCYSFASQVNDFCETDIGCQKRDHTRCWENACTCWPNYTIVDGNCRGLINAKCFVDSDCSIESSICASNTCQCPINFYLSADEKQCHSFAKHINDFCETDVGCRDLKFSYCSKDNKCTCLLGFIDDDGYCSGLIGSMCFKSLDCAADNAICDESKTCQCPVDFYLSVNKEECYPYAKKQTDFCETDIACRNLKYTYCSEDYKCACLQNYITVDGHCRSSINATCFEESDCAVNNSICDESNTCQCPVNSYLSSNNDNCNRYAQKMDDSCENNNSCRDLKFSYCSDNKKCTCLPNYKKLHGHCLGVIDANCFNDSDCAIENSICDTNICKCRIDSYLSASKNKCQSYANRVNDFCEANNSCRNLNNTYCSKDHKCVCLKNYTLIENYCRGFIGSNCSQDLDCASENSVCSKSTCQCHDNFYLSANETNCYAYAERIENFCEDDVGCRNLKYTYCSKNNKCTCLPNYVQVNDRCRGLINAKCLKDVDCAVNNSICDESNSCQCLNGFYLSANKGKCHQYAKQLDDFCETDDGCRNLKYAHCSKKNKCICLLNYTEAGGYCRGFIGSNCSENLDCLVDYLVCKSNVCQCPDNFYFSSSQQQCIPYAKQLKDFCETDKSCRDIKFTHCSENKQCTCLPNYVEKDGNCRGLIDEFCFEDSDCKVENSRCNSNVCQCSFDYYPSVNNDNCFKYAQNLTDYCEDNEGCRKIKYSFCSDDKNCTCFTPYKENGGQCLGVFNASCFNETDCDSFYECSSNRCSCRDNFVFDDYHKCIPVNRYLGDSCIDNEYCRSIEHSSCDSDYHCTCSTNYINVNGSCLHYLGTCCFKDSDCGIKDSICQGYTCKCKKKYFFHPFFIECRKK